MKKITVHGAARQECSGSSGGVRPVTSRRVMPHSFCPWKGQPARCQGPLQSLHYARALEWEGTRIDFKKQRDCSVHFKRMTFSSRVVHLISVPDVRWPWSIALLWVTPGLGAVWDSLAFYKRHEWKLLRAAWFTSSTCHPADLILTNICGSDLWVHCLLM